jgi:hypothetical protein
MALDNADGITRVPAHVTAATTRTQVGTIRTAVLAADVALATVKAATDAAVTAGLGMDDAATIALDVAVETASLAVTAVTTAINASGLPNA